MAQLQLKQWLVGAGGALLLSGSALAVTQSSQSPQPADAQAQAAETPVPNQAPQKDISALEKQATAFTEAWNQKDARAVSRLFTSNAALLVPSGATAVGRQQIEQAFTEELKQSQLEGAQMETRVETVRQLSPNLFLVDSVHSISGPNLEQHQGQPMEVHAVIVAEKRGNLYRFREARAIPEMPMQQPQTGVGGSGEQPMEEPQPQPDPSGSATETPPINPDTGGTGSVPPTEEPGTGGSGTEPQPVEPGTGGTGSESMEQHAPPADGSSEVPSENPSEPTY